MCWAKLTNVISDNGGAYVYNWWGLESWNLMVLGVTAIALNAAVGLGYFLKNNT